VQFIITVDVRLRASKSGIFGKETLPGYQYIVINLGRLLVLQENLTKVAC